MCTLCTAHCFKNEFIMSLFVWRLFSVVLKIVSWLVLSIHYFLDNLLKSFLGMLRYSVITLSTVASLSIEGFFSDSVLVSNLLDCCEEIMEVAFVLGGPVGKVVSVFSPLVSVRSFSSAAVTAEDAEGNGLLLFGLEPLEPLEAFFHFLMPIFERLVESMDAAPFEVLKARNCLCFI